MQGSGKSSGDQQQQQTSTMLESTGGRWLVGLIGLAIAAIGAGLIWYGVTKRFEKHLKTGQMSAQERKAARGLGIAGYAAKGTVYGTLGILVLVAALQYDPRQVPRPRPGAQDPGRAAVRRLHPDRRRGRNRRIRCLLPVPGEVPQGVNDWRQGTAGGVLRPSLALFLPF